MLSPKKITLELSSHEALVLFEFLSRFNLEDRSPHFEHDAEQHMLCELESELERQLAEPLDPNYRTYLREARERVRDPR